MTHLKNSFPRLNIFHSAVVLMMVIYFVPAAAANDDLYFICNKNVPVNKLSKFEVKNIFLGKQTKWGDRKNIVFVVLDKDEPFNVFLKDILQKSVTQYRHYWRHMIFTGKGVLPISFTSEEQLINYVAETDGAIGYLPSVIHTDKVKIIEITN